MKIPRCDVALFTNNASDPAVRRVFRDFRADWLEFFPADVPGATVDDLRAKTFATLPGRGPLASTFRFRAFRRRCARVIQLYFNLPREKLEVSPRYDRSSKKSSGT